MIFRTKYQSYRKGPDNRCNLCFEESKLTWDHVPPKGSITLQPVIQKTILEHFTEGQGKFIRPSLSQNGVKYKTICSRCNSDWLGSKYDPSLVSFSKDVGMFLKSNLVFPKKVEIRAKPGAIMRALIGHLIAAKTEIDEVTVDKDLRIPFFDVNEMIPEKYHIFYWVYPYHIITVIRDILMPVDRKNLSNTGVYSLLKYFPLGFMLTDQPYYEGLQELTRFRDLSWDSEVDIPVYLDNVKPYDWPNNVGNGNIVFGGASFLSSVIARPKAK